MVERTFSRTRNIYQSGILVAKEIVTPEELIPSDYQDVLTKDGLFLVPIEEEK